jgi:AcrR family transcriptional regulator
VINILALEERVHHEYKRRYFAWLLAGALVALLSEHRYTDLTIQDILDCADIGRTTFYRHYWDKDDLLASEMERVIDVLSRQTNMSTQDLVLPLPSFGIFQHVQEQHALYHVLVRGQAIDVVLMTIKTRLREQVEQHWHQILAKPIDDLSVRVTAQSVVGTFVTLLQWWMENDMPLSPAQMDAYFRQLTLPGVQAVLQIKEETT